MTADPSDSGADDGEERAHDPDHGDEGRAGSSPRNETTDGLTGAASGSSAPTAEPSGTRGGESRGDDGRRFTPEPSSARIEPGSPNPENVLFVLLGAIAMVLVILRLAAIGFGG